MTANTEILDPCELCNKGDLKKEYRFGMSDATVETYTCGHACCLNNWGDRSWHNNYSDAAGQARLIVALEAAK